MSKVNCWEFRKCGREPGGVNADALGVCAASTENAYHERNGGFMAGRYCWRVAGTQCETTADSDYASRMGNCMHCEFYLKVKAEEDDAFRR